MLVVVNGVNDGRPLGPPVEGSQTVERALRLLTLLGPGPYVDGLTVAQIAKKLGTGRPVVYRLVRSLENYDFVRRGPGGKIMLGFAVQHLAEAVWHGMERIVSPMLRVLADRVGATAHMSVLQGREVIAIAVVEPAWAKAHITYRVGSRHPVDKAAAGRAILLGRRGQMESTASEGELQGGAHGLAVPVLGVPELEASVGLIALTRLDQAALEPPLMSLSEAITRALVTARGSSSLGT